MNIPQPLDLEERRNRIEAEAKEERKQRDKFLRAAQVAIPALLRYGMESEDERLRAAAAQTLKIVNE